jgi:hypothetical protein
MLTQHFETLFLKRKAPNPCAAAQLDDVPLAQPASELTVQLHIRLWTTTIKQFVSLPQSLASPMPTRAIRCQRCHNVPDEIGAFIDMWKTFRYTPREVHDMLRSENIIIPVEYILRCLEQEDVDLGSNSRNTHGEECNASTGPLDQVLDS